VDFEQQTLAGGLEQYGFDSGCPAFFRGGRDALSHAESCMQLCVSSRSCRGQRRGLRFCLTPKITQPASATCAARDIAASCGCGRALSTVFPPTNWHRNSGKWDFSAPKRLIPKKSTRDIFKNLADGLRVRGGLDSLWAHGCEAASANRPIPCKIDLVNPGAAPVLSFLENSTRNNAPPLKLRTGRSSFFAARAVARPGSSRSASPIHRTSGVMPEAILGHDLHQQRRAEMSSA